MTNYMAFRMESLFANPGKILIVKPSSLGDVVHSLPFLNAIKKHSPKAAIHWVISGGLEGLLEGHAMIDKLWVIHKDAWKKIRNAKETVWELGRLFRELKMENFDLVIDLQGLLRSGVITAATRAPIRIGFKEAREGSRLFYTHSVEGGKDIHAVDRYLKIASVLGCDIPDISFPFPSDASSAPIFAPSISKDYIVFVPGARWETKIWPPENFGKLSALLPYNTVIAGSAKDAAIAEKIVALSGGKALSLAGKTNLRELIEIMKRARFIVSNDSGPMHIAAGLDVRVFAIFGPTDPLRTGPYGKGHTIIRANVSCAPCFKKKCADMKCMKSLSAEEVHAEITSALSARFSQHCS
jgi:heptosyltransferase-1